jgi:hypothetical protein
MGFMSLRLPGLLALLALSCPVTALAQQEPPPPVQAPSPLQQRAIDVYFSAEAAYRKQDYAGARALLQKLWNDVPPGDPAWKRLQRESTQLQAIEDFGTPAAYPALRMLTDCVEWKISKRAPASPPVTVQITVVLVGQSDGPEPDSFDALDDGSAPFTTRTLDPALQGKRAEPIFDEAYWLFDEYVNAFTQGRIQLHRVYVRLPGLILHTDPRPNAVHVSRQQTNLVVAAVPAEIARATDWWHIVYPSHVPRGVAFAHERFVTGGMRAAPGRGRGPCFLSEDSKLLRTANQNGHRTLRDVERRTALPQWLQHELFHYLFAAYRPLGLEATPHQWHDRKAWPSDFVGNVEADYYAEALHKRLQVQSELPLHVLLGTRGGRRVAVGPTPE